MNPREALNLNRRELLRLGLLYGGATVVGSSVLPTPASGQALCATVDEPFPTSPLILEPFRDPLPIPKALRPSDPATWRDPRTGSLAPPGPEVGRQDSDGGTHQVWPDAVGCPDPICYKIDVKVAQHRFTSSQVRPINAFGQEVIPPDGIRGPRNLPASTIYGFNGTFPGPLINAEYGRPVLVRFENHLHENPQNLDRQNFGAPDWAFLTHLHNGHTAPESDGNPHYKAGAYQPQQWVDNLYLNWPPEADARGAQSFFWFHDHRMDHTGANVYKGMVGLYPIYDPGLDDCNETKGLRLPGVRKNNSDGSFDVQYDIPLAFYDCVLDDGETPHTDPHTPGCTTHPEWWGKSFFKHYANHGFVGDVFTVNGVAYPVLVVKRRKYRLRFLDASIARIYEFSLMSSTGGPVAAPGTQGQYQLPDAQQCMVFRQIASEGGLLPFPIDRPSIGIWPAKRREAIVDFTKYMDGSPTRKGDVVYLVNTLQMTDGRKPDENPDPNYRVPVLKIVIDTAAKDASVMPSLTTPLRPLERLAFPVPVPNPPGRDDTTWNGLKHRHFELSRSGSDKEAQWLINGLPFDPLRPLADPKQGSTEVWTLENGGGGWVHPLHIHEEEHQVIWRTDGLHADDRSREDVVALAPGESVVICRKFRSFLGPYVCHCHNLAHEDHAMMFGWTIVP